MNNDGGHSSNNPSYDFQSQTSTTESGPAPLSGKLHRGNDKENVSLGINANQMQIQGAAKKTIRPSKLSVKELDTIR